MDTAQRSGTPSSTTSPTPSRRPPTPRIRALPKRSARFFSCPRCSVISSFKALLQQRLRELLEQPVRPSQGQPLLLGQTNQLLGSDLLSSRLGLLLRGHVVQCRHHHGTFPADNRQRVGPETPLDPQSPAAAAPLRHPIPWFVDDTWSGLSALICFVFAFIIFVAFGFDTSGDTPFLGNMAVLIGGGSLTCQG